MAHHPPHPQFLDVDWPVNHDPLQSQPLQLENEFDIDPSRYDLLQGGLQHPNADRRPRHQGTGFMMNDNLGRQQFGGTGDYVFTFPGPQAQAQPQQQHLAQPQQQHLAQPQQHLNQHYSGGGPGGAQYYSDHGSPFTGISFGDQPQSMPSSPFYSDDNSAFTYSHPQALPVGQHARTASNPIAGMTPTVRSFQGERTPVYSNGPLSPVTPNFGSSPGYGMTMPHGAQYRDPAHFHPDSSGAPHAAKRMRALDDGEGDSSSVDGDVQEDGGAQGKGEAKPPKPLGACARCKGLKVKCEFKTDPDTCKRCLNGGHECVIPGRKKRRAPPRRDLLLGQIREQAGKIEELMKQLEQANKRASQKQTEPSSPVSTTDPSNFSSVCTSELTASEFGTPDLASEQITKPDVLDWIAKARESIEAFGGYINMGGPSVTKDLLGEDVLGWKDSSSESGEDGYGDYEDFDDARSDIHVEVQDVDATTSAEPPRGRTLPEEPIMDETGSSNTQSSRRKKSRGREKLAILPNEAAPIGMLAKLSLRKSRSRKSSRSRSSVSSTSSNEFGVANDDYFRATSPGPNRPIMYAQHQTPYILRSGLVSPAEVEKLFKIFFDYINPSVALLDPVLYTAQKTYWRSPFLFTVVCGVSARFYSERPELYPQAITCARLAAGSTLIGGQKSVETVAAYTLLALYPVPARKWEEDRSWIYLGLAIRIATDLNLHHPHTAEPENEQHAREMLNRTRMWLNCFNNDRSFSSQYGKAPIISNTDYVANHSEFWFKCSPYNIPDLDIHLCAYDTELKVLADYRFTIFSDPDHPVGLNKDIDTTVEATKTDDRLARLWETWAARLRQNPHDSPCFEFRTGMLKVTISYARMTALSFAFQHAFGRDASQGFSDSFFWRCLRAAKDLIRTLVDELGAPHLKIFLRHAPDAQCVFVTFTCAFLIKLLHPRFANYIARDTRVEIRGMVEEVAEFLGSPDIAIDERHGPKMYSQFLKGLLDTPLASVDHLPAVIKRAMRSHGTSPSISEPHSERQSVSPPTQEQVNVKPETDMQMFDGLGLQTQVQSPPVDAAELYSPPLPFDAELLHSMQSLTDTTWSSMILPGFNWMDSIQQDTDAQMHFDHNPHVPQHL